MPRSTFVMRDGVLVDKRRAAPLVTHLPRAPGIFAPGLIRDGMDPIVHPCTGKLMDSKAAFRAVTRAYGCIELGNESPVIRPSAGDERARTEDLQHDIATAMEMTEHAPAASADAVFGAMGADAPAPAAADGWV